MLSSFRSSIFTKARLAVGSVVGSIETRCSASATSITSITSIRQFATFEASTRKKGGGKPIETIDMKKIVNHTFERIRDFVDPLLIPNNYQLTVATIEGEQSGNLLTEQLVLAVGAKGNYRFHYSPATNRFIYLSPVSGSQQYVYDIDEKAWLGYRDGHDFFGILTRDLIRHSIGLPKIS